MHLQLAYIQDVHVGDYTRIHGLYNTTLTL